MRTAIGVGSYGCVYRPPHKCAVHKNAAWYKNKISKLMLDRHSLIELNEYDKIDKIDKKKTIFLRQTRNMRSKQKGNFNNCKPRQL